MRPRTDVNALNALIKRGCQSKTCKKASSAGQGGTLEHRECSAQSWLYHDTDEAGVEWMVWEHEGVHTHTRPPVGSTLSHEQQEQLDQEILSSRDASVQQLRTGSTAPGSMPLHKISPVLSKPKTARYHVMRTRQELGVERPSVIGGGVGFLSAMGALNEKFRDGWIVDSKMHGPVYICIQSGWMRVMLEEAIDDWRESDRGVPRTGQGARHGCVTDGDHKFIRKGNLLVSCVYSTTLCVWVPVLYTWVLKLDIDHHRAHFHTLFRSIKDIAGEPFERKLLFNVRYI